jgi:serine protease Do
MLLCTSLISPVNAIGNGELKQSIKALKQTSRTFNKVAESASNAVVSISTSKTVNQQLYYFNPFFDLYGGPKGITPQRKKNIQRGLGSGVIVAEDGYIVTNFHVINNMDEIKITLANGEEFTAEVVGSDPDTDLALIKIDAKTLPTVDFGDSERLKVGDWAIAIGNPYGLSGTVTVGVISAKGRTDSDVAGYASLIQTDAAINPGNSGGALLNIEGKLIGINTAILSKTGGNLGIGFAVPSRTVKRVIDELKKTGKVDRGWLGVYIQPIDDQLQTHLNLRSKRGALVSDIVKESPAEKAGIQSGDIIVRFDGSPVADPQYLRSLVAQTDKNKRVPVRIIRDGRRSTLYVSIGSHSQEELQQDAQSKHFKKLGMGVEDLDEEIAKSLSLEGVEGVVITDITPNSPANLSGLRRGDIIQKVNSTYIKNVSELRAQLDKAKNENSILLMVKSRQYTRFVVLSLD